MNTYVKQPERVEAIQLVGFSSCGCTPAFNLTERELPTWAKDRLADGRLKTVPGVPSAHDPLGQLPALAVGSSFDGPQALAWPGDWILYSPITREVSPVAERQFAALYGLDEDVPGENAEDADAERAETEAERIRRNVDGPYVREILRDRDVLRDPDNLAQVEAELSAASKSTIARLGGGNVTGRLIGSVRSKALAQIWLDDLEQVMEALDVEHQSDLVMADVRRGFHVLRRAWLDRATGYPVDANRLKRWGGLGA